MACLPVNAVRPAAVPTGFAAVCRGFGPRFGRRWRGYNVKVCIFWHSAGTDFNQYIYSENDLTLALIVYRLLKLKDYKIAIWEISTNGIITSQLFKENSDFASVLEKAKFDYTECKDVDMLYEKALNFKKELSCEIALLVYRQEGEIEDCYQFAICYGNEIFLYKNIFKTDHKISLEMAKNAVLFNLAKKLRQNDITI